MPELAQELVHSLNGREAGAVGDAQVLGPRGDRTAALPCAAAPL